MPADATPDDLAAYAAHHISAASNALYASRGDDDFGPSKEVSPADKRKAIASAHTHLTKASSLLGEAHTKLAAA